MNHIKENHYCEATSSSASQNISFVLRVLKVHQGLNKGRATWAAAGAPTY